MNTLETWNYFATPVYAVDLPQFLSPVDAVAKTAIDRAKSGKKIDKIHPMWMSNNFFDDPSIQDFSLYVLNAAWDILDSQGYDMTNHKTYYLEMWCQEHHKTSGMEEHIHGFGSHISGFYFLNNPENSSRAIIYDPRPVKKYASLPEKDTNQGTYASQMFNFEPKPGQLLLMNSWLAHSFSRHGSDTPLRFVHFNIIARYVEPAPAPITGPGCAVII